ncbi:MAG: hypoxanthine phosphoribosyltransferase [Candidatus Latescibacteria bacterium]|nr:hypoxanthine phosphoribosyltransferase [Candidatus Latescibacterota bacterium]
MRPEVLFTSEEIKREVARLAHEISRDYRGRSPLLVGILKGSFVFLADLIRMMDIPVEVDFVILSSYGSGTESSGEVKVIHGLEQSIEGKDVIIVEDIVDSGITLSHFMDDLSTRNPASLRLCVLVDKTARREKDIQIDYMGMQVHDEFVVGYGIDCDEQYRYLPDICQVKD